MREVLKVTNLSKTYVSSAAKNEVLSDINLTVNQNDFVCILGPSGCGKSTLLRCIAGFEDYNGTIECNGKVTSTPSIDRVMVFQDYNQLFPWKTIEKNIQYPLKKNGIKDKATLKSISDEYIKKVGLDGYQKHYPHELSGGMKQRAAIAKALALKPGIILMDEPFAALDAITRNNLQRELHEIFTRENMTVIFITHNIQEALTLGTRILLMGRNGGSIVIDRTNTIEQPVTPSSEGYAEMWEEFSAALKSESTK